MEDINQNISVQPEPPPVSKKKNRSGCISKLAKLTLILFIVWWFNNCTLKTTKAEIKSDKIKNEIKIAVLSDLHASDYPFSISNERIVKYRWIKYCSK